jgi:hypothetical protein
MKRLLFLLLTFISFASYGQIWELNNIVRNNTLSPARVANGLDAQTIFTTSGTDTYSITATFGSYTIYAGGLTYVDGDRFNLKIGTTNTSGTTSLNVNTDGAIPLKDAEGNNFGIGDLVSGQYYKFIYKGSANQFWQEGARGGGGGGTPGGSDTYVQYNDASAFGGEADFVYDETTNTLTVDNAAVDTEVYDATGWNGDLTIPTKDAVRDKIETLGTGSGTVNSGTQYRIAYYATGGTAVSEAGAITASKALKSDANGVPTHFDTTTEPSLTELTYIKGVTSSVQAQINAISNILTIGTHDKFISSTELWPRNTAGCSFLTPTEMATSIFNVQTLDFDASTQEFAQGQTVLPSSWNNGTITVKLYWTATTTGSGGVTWGVSLGAYSNDDALTVALGTPQTVTDTFITVNDLHITAATAAITSGGTPGDGVLIAIQISRNPADGSDTFAQDAKLLGIVLTYTTDAGTD